MSTIIILKNIFEFLIRNSADLLFKVDSLVKSINNFSVVLDAKDYQTTGLNFGEYFFDNIHFFNLVGFCKMKHAVKYYNIKLVEIVKIVNVSN